MSFSCSCPFCLMAQEKHEWACERCTFVQSADNDQCELCRHPHQKNAKQCQAIIKTGVNKGKQCGCATKVGDYCGRHKAKASPQKCASNQEKSDDTTAKHQKNRPEPSPQPAIGAVADTKPTIKNTKKTKKIFRNSQAKLLLPAYCKSIQRSIAQAVIDIILEYYYSHKTIQDRIKLDIAYYEFACIGDPLYDTVKACKAEYSRQTKCISKYFDIEQQKYEAKFRPNSMSAYDTSFLREFEAFVIVFQPARMTQTKAYNSLKLVERYLNNCGTINIPIVLVADQWESVESDASLQRDIRGQLDTFCDKNKFVKWFPVRGDSGLKLEKCIEFVLSTIVIKRDMLSMEPFGNKVSSKNIMNAVFEEEGLSKLVIVEEDAVTVQDEMRKKINALMKEKEKTDYENDENEQGHYKYIRELHDYGGFLRDERPDEDNLGYLATANELHDYDDALWDAYD